MSTLQVLHTVGLTLVGSIAIAYTTLWLQNRIRRARLFKSLYHEVVVNSSVVKQALEILSFLEGHEPRKENKPRWTYFDVPSLHSTSYQHFLSNGEGLNLPEEVRMILEETYELILVHNRQISLLTVEWPPRTGGMSERLRLIIEKLSSLQAKMGKGGKLCIF